MKKNTLILLFITTAMVSAKAGDKVKLGLKFSPNVSIATILDKNGNDGYSYSSGGNALKFILGPTIDFHITENAAFCTGILYSPRTVRLKADTVMKSSSSQYNLQYLMIPVHFKFYTNEIGNDIKLYFNIGGTLDIKIVEKKIGTDEIGLKDYAVKSSKALFSYVDASLLLGTGVEYQMGESTSLFVGLSYNRGLTNIVNPLLEVNGEKFYKQLKVKNNLINLDFGIRF